MTKSPKIQILSFPGCPNTKATRAILREALINLKMDGLDIEEINIEDPATPEKFHNWPSPSILVNGQDVEGTPIKEAAACRIYPGSRTPRLDKIETALAAALL